MAAITSATSVTRASQSASATETAAPTQAQAAPIDTVGQSSFETAAEGPVALSADSPSSVSAGQTYRVSGGALVATGASGAELANETVEFMEGHLGSPEYQALTWTFVGAPDQKLALEVKADAMNYIANSPGLSAECDKMIAAAGAHSAKVDGLKVDFALNHFESVGYEAGLTWGKTEAAVKKMLAVEFTPEPVLRDTNGKSGITLAGPVSGGTRTFVNVDGSNNDVDFCTNPYPRATGSADVVLGGTNNSGQVDLVGTIVIKAGQSNLWLVKDPSERSTGSELAALNKEALAANAKNCDVVLEGNSADWSVRTSGSTAIYTNQKTKTSVNIPASAQGQVKYLPTGELMALAGELKEATMGDDGSAPTGRAGQSMAPTARLSPALEAVFSSMPRRLAESTLKFLLEKLGIEVTKGESLESMMQKLAAAMQAPGGPTVAQLKALVLEEAKSKLADAKKASEIKDPIDWYIAKTGKNKEAEMARWASEGKSVSRVREELGEWQKKETTKLATEGVVLAFVAKGLDQAAEADELSMALDAHTESIATAPAGADGKWARPLDAQPLEVNQATTVTATGSVSPSEPSQFKAGRDASIRRISERAISLGLSQQSYNSFMQRAAGELNHRTTMDVQGNDPKLPPGYSFPTPEIDHDLDLVEEAERKWGAKAGGETDPVLIRYDTYASLESMQLH